MVILSNFLCYSRNGVFHGYGNLHKGELVYEG